MPLAVAELDRRGGRRTTARMKHDIRPRTRLIDLKPFVLIRQLVMPHAIVTDFGDDRLAVLIEYQPDTVSLRDRPLPRPTEFRRDLLRKYIGLHTRVQHHQIGNGQRRDYSDDGHRGQRLSETEPALALHN